MGMREPAAGELNRRVTIRLRNDEPTDDMSLASAYLEVAQRWAKIEPLGTAVYAGAVQIGEAMTHRITFPKINGLTRAHEITRGAQVFRVRRVTDLNGRGVYTVVDVEELEPDI